MALSAVRAAVRATTDTAVDRRAHWGAHPDDPRCRSRGERRARMAMARAILRGLSPVEAVREACRVDTGLPAGVTQEAWDAYWTPDRLSRLALTWSQDPDVLMTMSRGRRRAQAMQHGYSGVGTAILAQLAQTAPPEVALRAAREICRLSADAPPEAEAAPDTGALRETARVAALAAIAARGGSVTQTTVTVPPPPPPSSMIAIAHDPPPDPAGAGEDEVCPWGPPPGTPPPPALEPAPRPARRRRAHVAAPPPQKYPLPGVAAPPSLPHSPDSAPDPVTTPSAFEALMRRLGA